MKKISILILCSCLLCACNNDKPSEEQTSLKGKTITAKIKNLNETTSLEFEFYSSSEYMLTIFYDDGYQETDKGTYTFYKGKLSLFYYGDTYEIVCGTKTKSKSSLDGTKWWLTKNGYRANVELYSTAFQYQYQGYYDWDNIKERGTYNYNGQKLTFSGNNVTCDIACGSILYDMAKE